MPASGFAEQVLAAVERIPVGRVMSYGDVAEYVDAPRHHRRVGQVMSQHGHAVPWWRVVRATGEPNPSHPDEARRRLVEEGTPMRPDGERVDMRRARWDGSRDS